MVAAVAFAALVVAAIAIVVQRQAVARLEGGILLEMKIRCAELLPAGHDADLAKLSPRQVAALSAASDEELGSLLNRAIHDRMTPDLIRKAIKPALSGVEG
jgi:hypothetical protein